MPIILCMWDVKTISPLEQRAQGGTTCAYYGAIIMAEYVAKQELIAEMEQKMRDVLTITQMETLQSTLLSVLVGYDVERNTNREDAVKSSQDMLQMFLDAKTTEGRTHRTMARYVYILNRFFNEANITAKETTVYHIRNYFLKEKNRGISDSTIAGYRDIFNSFFGWLFNEGLIQRNPCRNIGTVKTEKKVRKPFSAVEIQQICEACGNKRDKAIIMVLLNTGCRISEVCGMNTEDINTKDREIVVYGKGRKERTVYFDQVTAWVLNDYIKNSKEESEPLFCGKRGNRITPGGVRAMLDTLEGKCGVTNIHPHRFRRTFATNMINRGMPIQEVAALMGHDKIETTMKYIYQSKERTKNSYEHYSA